MLDGVPGRVEQADDILQGEEGEEDKKGEKGEAHREGEEGEEGEEAHEAGEKKEPQAPIFHVETYYVFKATREGYSIIDLKERLLTLTYVSFGQRF